MNQPIQMQIIGHAHPNALPILLPEDDVEAWEEALTYVVEHYVEHGLSFLLYGRGCCVNFAAGIPDKDDIERLCNHLTQRRVDRFATHATRLAA